MLTLASLGPGEVRARLRGPGLRLQTGPFVTCVHSPLAPLAATLGTMYADYPVLEEGRWPISTYA